MENVVLDQRFCQAALDGLKSYRRTELTLRFLDQHKLEHGKNLEEMWATIEKWVKGDPSRCRALLEYVDELRLWGRQRAFLFEVEEDYVAKLADPDEMRSVFREVYDEPLFQWEADEPFVALAGHKKDPATEEPQLVLKLIETRKYGLAEEAQGETFEERSTSFLIVNLEQNYAELRIQELPTHAERGMTEERDRMKELVGRYLEIERFRDIPLQPVMDELLHDDFYTVTSSRLRFPEPATPPGEHELVGFLEMLAWKPEPSEVSAFWKCEQDVLGERDLHFKLSGTGGSIGFDGIVDPARLRAVLASVVATSRGAGPPGEQRSPGGVLTKGAIDSTMKKLSGHPKFQATVLSAGAIAASIIWIVLEAIGNYFYDEALAWLLRGLPVIVLTVPIEIAWIIFYYGWKRVWRGFKVLVSLPLPRVWRAIWEARKRDQDDD